jgi:vacuolar-type H+-ATPase subunit E/Vma4
VSDGTKARALLEKLAADGEAEALAVVARAREEAQRIATESAARLAAAVSDAKAGRLARSAEREGEARLAAKSAARRATLGAQQGLVDRVMGEALAALAGAAAPEWLASNVPQALQYLPDGEARVRCAKRDVAAVKRLAADRAHTTVQADDAIAAGVIVELADGSVTVDATAESRLARMRSAAAIAIVAAVEGAR